MPIFTNELSILYASPHPYLIMSANAPDFTIVAVNQAFADLFQETEDQLVGKTYLDFLSTQVDPAGTVQLQQITTVLKEVIQHKKSGEYQIEFLPDQKVDARVFPLSDDKNGLKFLVQTFGAKQGNISIPQQFSKDSSELLEDNFQHPLFNDYPDPVFTIDVHGNFLSANNALLDLAECSKEELLQSSFVPFINPIDIERAVEHFNGAIKGIPQHFTVNVISTKGTHRAMDVTNLPLVINQEVIGIYVIARDITEAIQAREIAQEYNDRIHAILESISDGFFAVDGNWNVTYWNKEAEQILSMKKEDILGKNLWDVYQDAIPLKFYSEYHRAVAENVAVRFDEYFSPLRLWVEVSAFPSKDGLSVYFKDITFRKDTEALLNSEKEKYLELFNLNPIPQWVYDLESLRFLDVNEAAINHYGYSKAEFLSMTLTDIRPDQEVDLLKEIINHKVKKGFFNSSIVRHLKKDGKIIFVNVEGNSISFEGRDARLALAIDITQKLKTERALEASEHRFKALVQDGSDLIAILDVHGVYKYVSPTSSSILGIDPISFIGKSAFDFIHPDDIGFVIESFTRLKTTKRIQVAPFRYKAGSGEYRWIDTIITNMLDEQGVEGLVTNSRDITERMQDKIRMENSVERYEIVSKATSDAIWDWDVNTDAVTWNKGVKGIFGYDQHEYSHTWWRSQLYPEDIPYVTKQVEALIKGNKSKFEIEYRFRCADGTFKHVLDRGFIMFDTDGHPYRMIGSMQDITQRKKYIEKIEAQNRRLRDISWLQSHYVRAPLSQIMGLVKLLTAGPSQSSDRESLTYLAQAAEQLDTVIKRIINNTEGA